MFLYLRHCTFGTIKYIDVIFLWNMSWYFSSKKNQNKCIGLHFIQVFNEKVECNGSANSINQVTKSWALIPGNVIPPSPFWYHLFERIAKHQAININQQKTCQRKSWEAATVTAKTKNKNGGSEYMFLFIVFVKCFIFQRSECLKKKSFCWNTMCSKNLIKGRQAKQFNFINNFFYECYFNLIVNKKFIWKICHQCFSKQISSLC